MGTVATDLEMVHRRMEGGDWSECPQWQLGTAQGGVGEPKAVGKQVRARAKVTYIGTWAPCSKPLLLLSSDSRTGLGVSGQLSTGAKYTEMLLRFCDSQRVYKSPFLLHSWLH